MRWEDLVREIHIIYKNLDRDGIDEKSHIETVYRKLGSISASLLQVSYKKPEEKPVCRYLDAAIDAGRSGPYAKLCIVLKRVASLLVWEYGYESMPEQLSNTYAFTEVLGPNGTVIMNDLVSGFVLLAPGCYYPEHKHPGIEESYLCVSGRVTQNGEEVMNQGDFLYNHPGKMHTLTAGPDVPCLLAYVWNANPEVLRSNSMKLEE